MGYFIRFILALIVINFVIKLAMRFFFGRRRQKTTHNPYGNHQGGQQQQSRPSSRVPETQEERILDFQRKSFDSEEAEDADFIEVKDN